MLRGRNHKKQSESAVVFPFRAQERRSAAGGSLLRSKLGPMPFPDTFGDKSPSDALLPKTDSI